MTVNNSHLLIQAHSAYEADDFPSAENLVRQHLETAPKDAKGWQLLGAVLVARLRYEEALAAMQQAETLSDDPHEIWLNQAIVYIKQRHYDKALDRLLRALQQTPHRWDICAQIATVLCRAERYEEARALCQRISAAQDELDRLAWERLTRSLVELREYGAALALLPKAISLHEDSFELHCNLALVYKGLEKTADALAAMERAHALQPRNSVIGLNLAGLYIDSGRVVEAHRLAEMYADLEPNWVVPRLAMLKACIPPVFQSQAEIDQALGAWQGHLTDYAKWVHEMPHRLIDTAEIAPGFQPFGLAYLNRNITQALCGWGDLLADCALVLDEKHPKPMPSAHEERARIRLMIVSGQVRSHSVWWVLVKGIVAHLNRDHFELVICKLDEQSDHETAWAKERVDRFYNPPQNWLKIIADEAPDVILYPEIGMDSTTARLASRRLAPLQLAMWGHPVTSGLPTIDVYLSGELIEPDDAQAHYREKLIRLPGTGACTMGLPTVAEPLPADMAHALANLSPMLGIIPHRIFKLLPEHDGLWLRLLKEIPDFKLGVIVDHKLDQSTDATLVRLAKRMRDDRLDLARLVRIVWCPRPQFYSLLELCDVYLDPPSFSGYTTAWQAIHCGIPIVTLEGPFMRQRLASGLLRKIGATEGIARDEDEYVAIVKKLADQRRSDPDAYRRRREALRDSASRADQDVSVVRAFEATILEHVQAKK